MSKSFISLTKLCRTSRFWREESGQDLVEYALLGALIAVGCVVAMGNFATAIANEFTTLSGQL
jgi:pilus assembly protein Flp/PilA